MNSGIEYETKIANALRRLASDVENEKYGNDEEENFDSDRFLEDLRILVRDEAGLTL